MSVAEQLMGIEAVEMYVPGLVQKLALQEAEIEQLRSQVAELQAWKDAVPVEAIRIRTSEEYWDDHGPWDEIDAWLNTLDGAQPEVQP